MEDILSFTPLGAGQEVGRSCHLIEFRGQTILLDCGIHPGLDGLNGLPFLDRIEPEQVDLLLITHFHLDHAASLPYLTERTNFKGRIFMTHPTKAVLRLLLGDYLRLLQMRNAKADDVLYTEDDLNSCMNKIELIDFHTTVTVGGVSFYALNAGHVLGACMFHMTFGTGGRTLLYTGDYSMEDDRHLMAAELPLGNNGSGNNSASPDLLIVESTYGVQVHASRAEREARFTGTVEKVVSRGGRCLIPVFALGRAQELLLILDEYWQAHPNLQGIPIWYASKLASRALRVYQTYANMMNARIRAQMDISNPFKFRHIQNLKSVDVSSFDDGGPCVVFASPGMLQSGVSRQLFDRWAGDPKNGVLIAGYAVEHTMAKEIMKQPKEVVTMEGRQQPLNCLVDYVSFSAHVDFVQNRGFITKVAPKHIILVHGQKDEMGRLKSALLLQYKQYPENKRPTITMPPNLQEVKLRFARRRSAKVMGSLAEREPKQGEQVKGILVTHNFASKLVSPEDLATYTPLRVGSISSKLHVPFAGSIATLRLFFNEMFSTVKEEVIENPSMDIDDGESDVVDSIKNEDGASNSISSTIKFVLGTHPNIVEVTWNAPESKQVAIVKWLASPSRDILADAIVALIMHAQSSAASVRLTSQPCWYRSDQDKIVKTENNSSGQSSSNKRIKTEQNGDEETDKIQNNNESVMHSRLKFLYKTLKDQYSNVEAVYDENSYKGTFEIVTDCGLENETLLDDDGQLRCTATVTFDSAGAENATVEVECRDQKFGKNVQQCLRNVATSLLPIKI